MSVLPVIEWQKSKKVARYRLIGNTYYLKTKSSEAKLHKQDSAAA